MRRRPPRSTRTDTLFPYTTLFRSVGGLRLQAQELLVAAGTGDLGRELRDVAVPRVDPVVTLVVGQGLAELRDQRGAFLVLDEPRGILVHVPDLGVLEGVVDRLPEIRRQVVTGPPGAAGTDRKSVV